MWLRNGDSHARCRGLWALDVSKLPHTLRLNRIARVRTSGNTHGQRLSRRALDNRTRPTLTPHDIRYLSDGAIEALGQLALFELSRRVHNSNLGYLLRPQTGVAVPLPTLIVRAQRSAALATHISHVFFVGTQEQVVGVHAAPNIAPMANTQPGRNRPYQASIHYTVRAVRVLYTVYPTAYATIPTRVGTPSPQPTSPSHIDRNNGPNLFRR